MISKNYSYIEPSESESTVGTSITSAFSTTISLCLEHNMHLIDISLLEWMNVLINEYRNENPCAHRREAHREVERQKEVKG